MGMRIHECQYCAQACCTGPASLRMLLTCCRASASCCRVFLSTYFHVARCLPSTYSSCEKTLIVSVWFWVYACAVCVRTKTRIPRCSRVESLNSSLSWNSDRFALPSLTALEQKKHQRRGQVNKGQERESKWREPADPKCHTTHTCTNIQPHTYVATSRSFCLKFTIAVTSSCTSTASSSLPATACCCCWAAAAFRTNCKKEQDSVRNLNAVSLPRFLLLSFSDITLLYPPLEPDWKDKVKC